MNKLRNHIGDFFTFCYLPVDIETLSDLFAITQFPYEADIVRIHIDFDAQLLFTITVIGENIVVIFGVFSRVKPRTINSALNSVISILLLEVKSEE